MSEFMQSEEKEKSPDQEKKKKNLPVQKQLRSDIFDAVYDIEKSPCYLCARMRRGHLYSKAKLHSTNFEGMELIRPMYLIREEDIKHWRDYNDLHFLQCACKFTDNNRHVKEDGVRHHFLDSYENSYERPIFH